MQGLNPCAGSAEGLSKSGAEQSRGTDWNPAEPAVWREQRQRQSATPFRENYAPYPLQCSVYPTPLHRAEAEAKRNAEVKMCEEAERNAYLPTRGSPYTPTLPHPLAQSQGRGRAQHISQCNA